MNFDDHIQALQRQTGDLTGKITALTTGNADLKNKLTAVETLLANQKTTTVIAPEAPAPVAAQPVQNTVVRAPQSRGGGQLKQLLMTMLMSMMKPQGAQPAISPYANPLMGSALQPANPLLGANPSFGSAFNWPTSFTPQATQLSAYGGYGTSSLYGATNPLRF